MSEDGYKHLSHGDECPLDPKTDIFNSRIMFDVISAAIKVGAFNDGTFTKTGDLNNDTLRLIGKRVANTMTLTLLADPTETSAALMGIKLPLFPRAKVAETYYIVFIFKDHHKMGCHFLYLKQPAKVKSDVNVVSIGVLYGLLLFFKQKYIYTFLLKKPYGNI